MTRCLVLVDISQFVHEGMASRPRHVPEEVSTKRLETLLTSIQRASEYLTASSFEIQSWLFFADASALRYVNEPQLSEGLKSFTAEESFQPIQWQYHVDELILETALSCAPKFDEVLVFSGDQYREHYLQFPDITNLKRIWWKNVDQEELISLHFPEMPLDKISYYADKNRTNAISRGNITLLPTVENTQFECTNEFCSYKGPFPIIELKKGLICCATCQEEMQACTRNVDKVLIVIACKECNQETRPILKLGKWYTFVGSGNNFAGQEGYQIVSHRLSCSQYGDSNEIFCVIQPSEFVARRLIKIQEIAFKAKLIHTRSGFIQERPAGETILNFGDTLYLSHVGTNTSSEITIRMSGAKRHRTEIENQIYYIQANLRRFNP